MSIAEAWIEVDLGDAWIAAYRITPQDGVPVIAELRVFPREPESVSRRPGEWTGAILGMAATVPRGGVMARLLRQLCPGADLQEGVANWPRNIFVGSVAAWNLYSAGFRNWKRPPRTVGRRGWSEKDLLRAAVFYVETGGQHPVKDLAKAWRLKNSAQARDLLQAARNKGFLTAGRLGVTSRVLTDKAHECLAALELEQETGAL